MTAAPAARDSAIVIRVADDADAAAIARLTTALGYPTETKVAADRLSRLLGRNDHRVWIAERCQEVIGWLQAHACDVLESGFRVEIVGLIVAADARRSGVGRALVQQAETWARELGATAIIVRSNVQRAESHRFYPALGFATTKTQSVYRKNLVGPV